MSATRINKSASCVSVNTHHVTVALCRKAFPFSECLDVGICVYVTSSTLKKSYSFLLTSV